MTDDQEPEPEQEPELDELDDTEFSLNPENEVQDVVEIPEEIVTEEIVVDEKFTLEASIQENQEKSAEENLEELAREFDRESNDNAQGAITNPDHGLDLLPQSAAELEIKKPKPLQSLLKHIHGNDYEEKREQKKAYVAPMTPGPGSPKVANLVHGSDGTLMLPIRFKVINDPTHGPDTSRGRDIIRKVCIDFRGGDLTMEMLQKRVNRDITGKIRGTKDILSIIDIYAILAHAQAYGYYEPRTGKMVELQAKRRRSTGELTVTEFVNIVRYWRIKGATGTRPTALQCKENSEQLGLRKDLFLDPIAKILKALANRHHSDYHGSSQTPEAKRINNLKFEVLSNFQAVIEEILLNGRRLINPRTGKNILVIECDDVINDPIKNQFLSLNFENIMNVFEDANSRNLKLQELDIDSGVNIKSVIEQQAVDTADIREAIKQEVNNDLDLAVKDVHRLIESEEFKQITDEEFTNMTPDEQKEFLIELKRERRETFRKLVD